jgi:GxxExxY protein
MGVVSFRNRETSGVDARVEDLAAAVIAAAIEVHMHIGPGQPESTYKAALCHELSLRGIPHRCEVPFSIPYKGKVVGEGRVDILVDEALVLELKSVDVLAPVHRAQARGYLQALGLQLALLINFNVAILKDGIKRVIHTR